MSYPNVETHDPISQEPPSPLPPTYTITPKDILEGLHREIDFRRDMISSRMNWYVVSQAFLMSAFSISGGNGHDFRWLAKVILPELGIIISIMIWFVLRDAIAGIEYLRRREFELISADQELRKLLVADTPEKTLAFHLKGKSALRSLPLLFLTAWVVALILTWTIPPTP